MSLGLTQAQRTLPIIHVGRQITKHQSLSPAEISYFALLCGDHNPLHHDESYARTTRFGEIIACGAHTTSLLIGATGTYFSQSQMMVGLEYQYKLLAPIKPGHISIMWEIVEVQTTPHGKKLVAMQGKIIQEELIAVEAQGKVLVADHL